MTGWLTVIQQMLGWGGLTKCFNSNQLLLLSRGTPHTREQRVGEKIAHMYVCKYLCVCGYVRVCWLRQGADGEKKGDSHSPLRLMWGQTTGFNQLGRMCLCTCACVCVAEQESAVSGERDVAANASATVGHPRQPGPPPHRPRLSPPSYSPSISLRSAHLHAPPSATHRPSL